MNWIVRNNRRLKFQTNLDVLLEPIQKEIQEYKWLVSDLEINTSEMEKLPINHEKDWFLITAKEMEVVRKSDTQIVWGAFSAINQNLQLEITEEMLPFAEGAPQIWKNGNLQVKESEIEIIAWDSSCTIIKFTDENLSNKWKEHFDEAILLEEHKWK